MQLKSSFSTRWMWSITDRMLLQFSNSRNAHPMSFMQLLDVSHTTIKMRTNAKVSVQFTINFFFSATIPYRFKSLFCNNDKFEAVFELNVSQQTSHCRCSLHLFNLLPQNQPHPHHHFHPLLLH
jgi:hypothetical protein